MKLLDPFDWCAPDVLDALQMEETERLSRLSEGLESENTNVRLQAVQGIGSVSGPASGDEVRNLLADAVEDEDHRVRAAAVEKLKEFRDPQVEDILKHAVEDGHFLVRFKAKEAMAAIKDAG